LAVADLKVLNLAKAFSKYGLAFASPPPNPSGVLKKWWITQKKK
jgi:hypothetical protein